MNISITPNTVSTTPRCRFSRRQSAPECVHCLLQLVAWRGGPACHRLQRACSLMQPASWRAVDEPAL
jgi:hypothetical protein